MVENALYLFPDALQRVTAMADGNQGKGFFAADLDPAIDSKTVLPRNANTEAILATKPDVVVMKNSLAGRIGEPLERMGIRTVYLDLESPEAWMTDLDKLGALFGDQARAETLKDLFNSRIERVTRGVDGLADSEKPRTLFLYWSVVDGSSAVNIPPMDWIQSRMVQMAGGLPVWEGSGSEKSWARTGVEQIAAWNPDVIVVAAYHADAVGIVRVIRNDPVWSGLNAVRSGEVYPFPSDYHSWDQPDVRWLLGLQWMAGILHPESFRDLDMEAEARKFYYEMFGMDQQAFTRYIVPRLSGID
jgi:iron complex transport system substrate-binding protein